MRKKEAYEKSHLASISLENEYVTDGLLHYNDEKRKILLKKAEELCYSKTIIDRLKNFTTSNWNSDSVTVGDIKDLQSIEEYVRKYTPGWEKSIFSLLGKIVLGTE